MPFLRKSAILSEMCPFLEMIQNISSQQNHP